ncbi:nucleotidyltransferase domain-containing protein [Humisphaera borealis]|uniref:Nucleotidyltransferase domain-containing protein n=1 Tax=Humisphaera borealis TaxID=2807512 RepID=A0A7M2WZ21_9BACT|nr:nucleotidyltransferase domain-containing protein [Humisphaera borealis]QOV89730.1 nucleotidyltransferase domain-containing protein [Humisphaera borealis]
MITGTEAGDILFGRTRRAILALTFLRPDESFYMREIVRRTGCGTGPVQRELKLLTDCGILRRDRQRFFRANPDSAIYEPLKQIVIRTVGLGERLRATLNPFANDIAVAFIFGSFSRGEQREQSDVDVLVVTKDSSADPHAIDAALASQQSQVGRAINPFVLPAEEWARKYRSGNAFVQRVSKSEKTYLIGDDDELERLAEERVAEAAQPDTSGSARPARAGRSRSAKREGQRSRQ